MSSAYLILSHGSRDPRPQIAVERLAYLVGQQLMVKAATSQSVLCRQRPLNRKLHEQLLGSTALLSKVQSPLIGTACLELAAVPLHQKIQEFAQQVQASKLSRLQILPLFLLSGVHVKEDIPAEVTLAQETLEDAIELELRPYLGSYPNLIDLLAKQYAQLPAEGRILLAHGSRLKDGNQPCEAIAAQLQALPAYWSTSPSLVEQMKALAQSGVRRIAVLPYFLFTGSITEAIAQQVQQLQRDYPNLQLCLGEPLGATPELANLIVEGLDR